MTNPLTGKKLTTRSLWGKLNLYSSALVMVTVVSGIILFSTLTMRIQERERGENLKALASTLARLVARPVSLGDYLLVENYINGEGLPDFLESIVVRDRTGQVIAGKSRGATSGACSETTTVKQAISDLSPLSTGGTPSANASIELVASSCDIAAAQRSFGLTSLGFGLVVFLFLVLVNRASIHVALRPLLRTVKDAVTVGQLEDCVIQNSPHEIRPLMSHMRNLYKKVSESESRSKVGEFAAQVAHDIRSPLAALDSTVQAISLPEESRITLNGATSRIRDIANSLIELNRRAQEGTERDGALPSSELFSSVPTVQLISSLVDSLITEKRTQYRTNIGLVIEGCIGGDSYGLFARVEPIEFKRLLSNLIDNAVEAISGDGRVSVSVSKFDSEKLRLTIADNGKGIPSHILPRLMQKGATFGKPAGSGLGLYHARSVAQSFGGDVRISSQLGRGTEVSVILPLGAPPSWFVNELRIYPESTIVILDDDATIHRIWQGRLDLLRQENPQAQFSVVHLSTPSEMEAWVKDQGRHVERVLYLVDYELCAERTGVDLISELGIGAQSILVTSRFEENTVLERVMSLGLRLIPKGMAGFAPIVFAELQTDAVLIDNDSLIRRTWEASAERAVLKLRVYHSVDDFLAEAEGLPRSIPIFIDSGLDGNLRGEIEAERIAARGFSNLTVTTGQRTLDLSECPWIKTMIGKMPPWDRPRSTNVRPAMRTQVAEIELGT